MAFRAGDRVKAAIKLGETITKGTKGIVTEVHEAGDAGVYTVTFIIANKMVQTMALERMLVTDDLATARAATFRTRTSVRGSIGVGDRVKAKRNLVANDGSTVRKGEIGPVTELKAFATLIVDFPSGLTHTFENFVDPE